MFWASPLIQDVRTRWNSTLEMISRLVEQRWVIVRALDDLNKSELNIRSSDWKLFEALIPVLEPFKVATQRLSGQKYITLSLLNPELKKLRKVLIICDSERGERPLFRP